MDKADVENGEIITPAAASSLAPVTVAPPPRLSAAHLPALDGLRGIAVLLVISFHFGGFTGPGASRLCSFAYALSSAGWIGVDLFFVLSGFLITGILWDTKSSAHYFRTFYARRFLRIFPLYYAALAVVFILVPAANHFGILHLANRPGTIHTTLAEDIADLRSSQWLFWTFTQNILGFGRQFYVLNHFWSLAVEEHFYLVWPAIVLLCSVRRFFSLGIALCVGCLAARCIACFYFHDWFNVYTFTLTRVDSLAIGGMLAVLVRHVPMAALRRPALFVFCASAALIVAEFLYAGTLLITDTTLIRTVGFTVIALFFGAVLILSIAAPPRAFLARVLSTRWLRAVGRYSYAMYVLHRFVILIFAHMLDPNKFAGRLHSLFLASVIYLIVMVAITFAVAFVSWHMLEKHFLRLKRYFPYQGQTGEQSA